MPQSVAALVADTTTGLLGWLTPGTEVGALVFAAIFAFAAQIWSSASTARSTKLATNAAVSANRASARRELIGGDLQTLSNTIYEIVAETISAAKSKRFPTEAIKAGQRCGELRQKYRYIDPTLFDTLSALQFAPSILTSNYEAKSASGVAPKVDDFKRLLTELREALDDHIKIILIEGENPPRSIEERLARSSSELQRWIDAAKANRSAAAA